MAKAGRPKSTDKVNLLRKESFCLACNRTHDIAEFYPSDNPFHCNGVLPYCKSACRDISVYYIKSVGGVDGAMFYTCATVGMPFVKEALDVYLQLVDEKKEDVNINYFYMYYKELQKAKKLNPNLIDFTHTDVDISQVSQVKKSERAIKEEVEELRLKWGGDKTPQQLQYLEYRYGVYTEDKELTEYQAKLYRSLCLAELNEYEGVKVKESTEIQAKIAKTLGLDQFNIDKELSMTEKMLEMQIALIEEEEPAIYYKDLYKYADFMGIGKYWENHIIRPLRNILLNQKEYNILPEDDVPVDMDLVEEDD